MGQPQQPREPLLGQFLQLLVWVRERPEDYCSTLGQLADLLHQMYDLCATADGNAGGFNTVLAETLANHAKPSVGDLLTTAEHGRAFTKNDLAAKRLIAFWTTLDAPLNFPSPVAGF